MQIQWATTSYQARALPLSAQRCINFYAEQAPKDAKDPVVLYGTPGIKEWANPVGNGPIRGTEVMDGVLYAVSGCVLYSVDANGKATALGSIAKGGAGEPGASGEASATFQITDGSASAGTNQITLITVDGVEISGAVDWSGSNANTASLVALAINGGAYFPPTYDSNFKDVSTELDIPTSVTFRPDGLKMYLTNSHDSTPPSGSGNAGVSQYQVANAWDLSSAAYESIFLDAEAVNPTFTNEVVGGVFFNVDGTKLFLQYSGDNGSTIENDVHEYSLTNAYEINSASFTQKFSILSEIPSPETGNEGLEFNADGTKMYVGGQNALSSPRIFQYSLATGFDVSTASYDSVELNVSAQATFILDFVFSSDGHKLYVLFTGNDNLHEYHLSTAFDLSTAVNTGLFFNVRNEDTNPQGLAIGDGNEKFFMCGRTNDFVYRYSAPVPRYGAFIIGPDSDRVQITALEGTGTEANDLPVVITTSGDVQVDDNNLTMTGGFVMPGSDGTGTTPGCFGKVSMSHNAASTPQLVIVDGTNGWIYTTTDGLVEITDDDFFAADVVDFQDQYFAFNRAGTGQWFLSNLNDGTLYTATDIATAEGDPDDLVALISNRRELWLFGAQTIEIWYNSGNVDFPFSRFEGGFLERGCAAAFSIAEDDNSLFWLGEDRIFYRADGYTPQRISQHGIEEALRKYPIVEDACAFIYTMAGHKFYVVTFPAVGATWVYDITTGLWHERHSFGMTRWRVSTHVEAYGKHLVGDFEDGKIGELDLDTYQEYGVVMQGQATGPSVYKDRKRIFHRRFELDIEAGTGLTSGQGSDPQVWLDWSDDGGHTWSARKPFRSMGKIGAYMQRLRWLSLGSSRQRIYHLTVSDPVKRSIIAAHLDAEVADH